LWYFGNAGLQCPVPLRTNWTARTQKRDKEKPTKLRKVFELVEGYMTKEEKDMIITRKFESQQTKTAIMDMLH
jgi:hypothetical protein